MTVYETHDKAFANVSAYAIVSDGARVANISFKFPRDGAIRDGFSCQWGETLYPAGESGADALYDEVG